MPGLNDLSKGSSFFVKLYVVNRVEYKQSVWNKLYRVNIGDTSE